MPSRSSAAVIFHSRLPIIIMLAMPVAAARP